MSYPIGYFDCKLDSKGRLMIPSDFKEQMGEQIEEGFVIRPSITDKCLDLYTRKDWDEIQEKLRSSIGTFNKVHLAAIRRFNDSAKPVKLDASGRLQIPKSLIEKGFIKKEIVIASETTKMEIWDKDLYNEAISSIDDDTFLQTLQDLTI